MQAEELKKKWDAVYQERETEALGWYEESPQPSLDTIESIELLKSDRQLHVGVGSSTLIDHLLDLGYENLIANDLSEEPLEQLQERLGSESSQKVTWLVEDLLSPDRLESLAPVKLWHDRAVLHFFTDAKDRERYRKLLDQVLAPNGHVIIGVFHKEGAKVCNRLPVHGHDTVSLQELLGSEYKLIESFDYCYINPRGEERPYIYAHFQRCQNTDKRES